MQTLDVVTPWPYGSEVLVTAVRSAGFPGVLDVALRIPAWVGAPINIFVDGNETPTQVSVLFCTADQRIQAFCPLACQGTPGTYVHVFLPTGTGNISFALPMSLRAWPYNGDSQVPGFTRCAYTYGPLLLAAQGPWNATVGSRTAVHEDADGGYIVLEGLDPTSPGAWASRRPGDSLVFDISPGGPGAGYTLVPYFEIQVGSCLLY